MPSGIFIKPSPSTGPAGAGCPFPVWLWFAALQVALDHDLRALCQILLSELCQLAEGYARYEVGRLLVVVVSALSTIDGESVPGDRHRLSSLCVSYFWISGESSHLNYFIHALFSILPLCSS